MLAEFSLKTFFVWFFPGQTIRVPWKEDSARGSVQKFEVNPVNDLVAFQGKYGQIHLMSSRSRSKLFTLKMNDEVIFLSTRPKKTREMKSFNFSDFFEYFSFPKV